MRTERIKREACINVLEINPSVKVCDRLVFFFFSFIWFGFWRFETVRKAKRLLTKAKAE